MPASDPPSLTVVGIGADGWQGLARPVRDLVVAAPVVVGAPRHLGLLPDVPGQVRRAWGRPLRLDLVDEHDGPTLVLASGDPMLSGIGSAMVARWGADRVRVVPTVSSVALARARMGWAAETVEVVTTVGRPLEVVLRQLAPARRLLVLSSDARTPAALADLLVGAGYGRSVLTVLGDLGAGHESRLTALADDWADGPHAGGAGVSPLNVVALDLRGPGHGSWAAGLPDSAFEHDGQLTKRDLRASALARLRPLPGQLLWDVGAGAGSVGIEWLRAHPTCGAVAVEQAAERAARIRRNAAALGVPALRVVEGAAPAGLVDLPDPDAVFVGGGATVPGLLDTCRQRLRPGGRLVVHGVTLETEVLLARQHGDHGGELTRHAVETAAPIGSFTGWTPARTVTQWAWEKPHPHHTNHADQPDQDGDAR